MSRLWLFVCSAMILSCLSVEAAANGDQESCNAFAAQSCMDGTSTWTDGGKCNAVYGGYKGNRQNLQQLMANHLKDSFNLILMASSFNTDEINRMGTHGFLQGYSDKMWGKAKDILHYMLHRGAKVDDVASAFNIRGINSGDSKGEVKALATTLDILKKQAEDSFGVYKHADNKHVHADPSDDSYDPSIAHFIEEEFLEDYTDDIRTVSGHLNVLAKIAKDDKTRGMGLHLFDSHLG